MPRRGNQRPAFIVRSVATLGRIMAILAEPQRTTIPRRHPHGAELVAGGTSFRVWAPERAAVAVVIEGRGDVPLEREADGYFSALVPDVGAGARYRIRLDNSRELLADPASRAQPE